MTAIPTPEEVEAFLAELDAMSWDYALEEDNLFEDEPDAEPEAEYDEYVSPEDAAGWRWSLGRAPEEEQHRCAGPSALGVGRRVCRNGERT